MPDAPESTTAAAPPPGVLPKEVERALSGVKTLWSIPANVLELQKFLRDPETPIDPICKSMERDPALVAHCLKVVNSALFGLSQKIVSIRRAIVTLGYDQTCRIVSVCSLIHQLGAPHKDIDFDLNSFWEHSLRVAHAAQRVAKLTRLGQPDEHFSAGLMHDIGKLVEYQYLRPSLKLVLAAVREGRRFEEAEREILKIDHAALGAVVCERWGLPAMIVETVRRHLDPRERLSDPAVPREAATIASLCALDHGTPSPEDIEAWGAILRLPADRLQEVRAEAAQAASGALKEVFAPAARA